MDWGGNKGSKRVGGRRCSEKERGKEKQTWGTDVQRRVLRKREREGASTLGEEKGGERR